MSHAELQQKMNEMYYTILAALCAILYVAVGLHEDHYIVTALAVVALAGAVLSLFAANIYARDGYARSVARRIGVLPPELRGGFDE